MNIHTICISFSVFVTQQKGMLWPWLYASWIYNYMYLCNQCLSPLKLWVWILLQKVF